MADVSGKDGVIFLGNKHLSGYFQDLSISRSKELADSSKFGATSHSKLPLPMYQGRVVATGIYDGDASLVAADVNTFFTDDDGDVMTVAPAGTTIGNEAFIMVGEAVNVNVSSVATDKTNFTLEAQSDGGTNGMARALWHKNFAAVTGVGSGTSIDNTASSASGGEASVHATAFTGTSVTPIIQHSVDNAAWVDLITFTAISGGTSERRTVAGTVNRYTREDHSTGAFTSATYAAAFGRY